MTLTVEHVQTAATASSDPGIAWAFTNYYSDAVSAYAFGTISANGPCQGCAYNASDTTARDAALNSLPVIASYAEYQDAPGATGVQFHFGFAVPPGVSVCAHITIVRQVV